MAPIAMFLTLALVVAVTAALIELIAGSIARLSMFEREADDDRQAEKKGFDQC